MFKGTEVGGLSGITYDAKRGAYFALSDDRSQINPARFYMLDIDIADGVLEAGDIKFLRVMTLRGKVHQSFPEASVDPEGIACTSSKGMLYISSEGDADNGIAPFVKRFSMLGLLTWPAPRAGQISAGNGFRHSQQPGLRKFDDHSG